MKKILVMLAAIGFTLSAGVVYADNRHQDHSGHQDLKISPFIQNEQKKARINPDVERGGKKVGHALEEGSKGIGKGFKSLFD